MAAFGDPKLNLRMMGFCGADDSVSPELMQILSVHYSWIEWGMLFRPDLEGQPRYATKGWVQQLCKLNKDTGSVMRLAGHLCGSRCQEVLDGDFSFVEQLRGLGFGRVQVNATRANNVNVDSSKLGTHATNLLQCMAAVPEIEWIFQLNSETRPLWDEIMRIASSGIDASRVSDSGTGSGSNSRSSGSGVPRNCSVLFDASCGLGVLASEYPAPLCDPVEILSGYAGGIGPSNITEVLDHVSTAAKGKMVWVDMESSLRTTIVTKRKLQDGAVEEGRADVFSIDKCFACVLVGTQRFGLPVSRFPLVSI